MANTTLYRWRAVGTPPRLPAFCSGFHAGAREGEDRPKPRQHWARVIIGSFARSSRNRAIYCNLNVPGGKAKWFVAEVDCL
jgi:hypothetical protein